LDSFFHNENIPLKLVLNFGFILSEPENTPEVKEESKQDDTKEDEATDSAPDSSGKIFYETAYLCAESHFF